MPDPISNNPSPRTTPNVDLAASLSKGLGLSAKAADVVKDVAAILSGRGVNVTTTPVRNDGAGTPTGATNVPALDQYCPPASTEIGREYRAKAAELRKLVGEEAFAEIEKPDPA